MKTKKKIPKDKVVLKAIPTTILMPSQGGYVSVPSVGSYLRSLK